jgi:hypothetical protein
MQYIPNTNNTEQQVSLPMGVNIPTMSEMSTIPDMPNPEDINSLDTLLMVNHNLRTNIRLSLSIYKKLNNFDHKYIHELLDGQKTKSS